MSAPLAELLWRGTRGPAWWPTSWTAGQRALGPSALGLTSDERCLFEKHIGYGELQKRLDSSVILMSELRALVGTDVESFISNKFEISNQTASVPVVLLHISMPLIKKMFSI